MKPSTHNITLMLKQLNEGNQDVVAELVPLLYDELRRLAAAYLRRERSDHTLQPTALVHEAYLRLVDQKEVHWQNRSHFFGIAAQQMRRILLDYARSHKAAKRGGLAGKLSLEQIKVAAKDNSGNVVALDETLSRLEAIDAQQAKIVELRIFGGLTVEEVAEVLGISPATVKRDLAGEDFLYVRVGDFGYGLVSASKSIADSVHNPASRRT
jgi:RNA polymerase sigma-70 factor (ECF subfamily)